MLNIKRWYSIPFDFCSVRNRALRFLRHPVVSMALLILAVTQGSKAFQFPASVYDSIKPSVLRVKCGTSGTATGFLWSSHDKAVTALHVVAGCANIIVDYEKLGISRSATVAKVLRDADLALLTITNAPDAQVLSADSITPSLSEQLSTLGYPLQIPSMTPTALRLRYGGKKLRDIVPNSVAQALSGGPPSLDQEIDPIEGHLLPGDSGAPVFNVQRKIVAIADGGLDNGAVAVSWAIPAKFLNQLAISNENVRGAPTRISSAVLFSAESDMKNMGETACSGLTLTKLRTMTFAQVSQSADDPNGLNQLVQFFNVDPSSFTFDVYQHLSSGATLVLPSGAHLHQAPNGDCIATPSSSNIEIRLQLGVLSSPAAAQSKSLSFEQILAGGRPQEWVADPQWTYAMPVPRFDNMIIRRRAYGHFVMVPTMFLDKYLFEALAVRNNIFMGSAAMYSLSPELAQRMVVCRVSPAANNCDDVRRFFVDWVKSALAVQLSTFPIG